LPARRPSSTGPPSRHGRRPARRRRRLAGLAPRHACRPAARRASAPRRPRRRHRAAAEALAAGPHRSAGHALWDRDAGKAALALLVEIEEAGDASGPLAPTEYRALLGSLLASRQVPEEAAIPPSRHRDLGHARGQNPDRLPRCPRRPQRRHLARSPAPDPWLSRPLRRALGLPAPETLIGLSAHDFVQAAAAESVVLSRATRDAEAPTVPSRWLLRLENLLGGLGAPGREALAAARDRGERWLDLARRLDRPGPLPPARRPRRCRRPTRAPAASPSPRSRPWCATPTPSTPATCSACAASTRPAARPTRSPAAPRSTP
jgi:ATP-dependent helicase/nuclease subunit B